MTETTPTPETLLYEQLVAMFGDRLADPEVFPATFAYQVKIARYEQTIPTQANPPQNQNP